MNTITLFIAGFKIKLQSEADIKISLEEGYLPFVSTDNKGEADVCIYIKKHLPVKYLNKKDLIFEAKENEQKFYSIYRENQYYKFIIYKQDKKNEIQQIAFLDESLTKWTIYAEPSVNDKTIYPFLYPLGPLVLYYLTVKFEAIMIHASGVYDGEKGWLFAGFSGAGKSTMADLWLKSGSSVINDDRLIIRNTEKGYIMYNTPMFYNDLPKETDLNSINIIKHAGKNTIKKLNGAKAVSQLMACCIQHDYNSNFIEHHLQFISNLCDNIPVYELGFLPDKKIIDFIKTHAG